MIKEYKLLCCDYEWITDEMFDIALMELIADLPLLTLVRVPGIYEILAEKFNNEVLTKLENERGEEE
jgi:hypothetical protein